MPCFMRSFVALACTLKLQGIQLFKETTQVIEFYVIDLPVRTMIGRLDFSALLAHASALLVHCLGNFFSVRPVDQWRRQLKVTFYSRCCVMGSRTIRLIITVVVKSRITHLKLRSYAFNQQSSAKNIGKTAQVKKNCNHKWNINGIYNKKLSYNCLQQLPTLMLKT